MKNKIKGFTLIEVLIALLIIAIALAAVMKAMTQSIRVTAHVKTSMASHWVAMNVLSEMQLGMLQLPIDKGIIRGSTVMFGNTWRWQAVLINQSIPYAKKIRIVVKRHKQSVGSLIGYVRS